MIYVVARLPEEATALAAPRGHLMATVLVLKQIAAVAGQQVCIQDGVVYVDGVRGLHARVQVRGAFLPWLQRGASIGDEPVLLNGDNAASFDSRYFAPID